MNDVSAPPPYIAPTVSYEALFANRLAAFVEAWDAFRAVRPDLDLPAYDVGGLETDPAVIALQAVAYGDEYFRQLLNDTARAALLVAFATGADLDLHGAATRTPAAPEGIARQSGEADVSYRARIIAARAGSSAAGPDDWWLSHVRAAHADATGAAMTYQGMGRLTVAVSIAAGADISAVLAAVRERLALPSVKPQGITVTVVAA